MALGYPALGAKLAQTAVAAVLATPVLAMPATQAKVAKIARGAEIRRDEETGFLIEVLTTVRASVMQRHVPEGETVVEPPQVTMFSVSVLRAVQREASKSSTYR